MLARYRICRRRVSVCLSVRLSTFLSVCPNYIFGQSEARRFKFRVMIDTQEYWCMHDILLPKRMCSESRDLLKFWEISNNISEMVQDRDIFTIKD